jgi:hypothetical protein
MVSTLRPTREGCFLRSAVARVNARLRGKSLMQLRRMAAAVAGTVGGLYIVMTQDLSHGEHSDHVEHAENKEAQEEADEEAPALQEEKVGSKQTAKEESSDATNVDAPKVDKDDANEEGGDGQDDDSKHSESREKAAEDKKKEHKDSKAQSSQEDTGDEDVASPDKSDKVSADTSSRKRRLTAPALSPQRAQELQRDVRKAAGHVQRRDSPQLANLQAAGEVEEG